MAPRSADARAAAIVASAAGVVIIAWIWARRAARRHPAPSTATPVECLADTIALRRIFHSKMGLDIGGTLTKLVFASAPGTEPLGHVSTTASSVPHPELSFTAQSATFHFVTLPTHRLEETARVLRQRLGWPPTDTSARQIVAAGGGALKFARMFRQLLHVELLPFKELEAVVRGLAFLRPNGPQQELFTIETSGAIVDVPWPTPLYPFLLVNMGSGSSVLRVSGPHEFVRVGGTACGGATFLGLARALTGLSDFGELMKLVEKGTESRVDKSVGDIYGPNGCEALGLPACHTAASFGRVATASEAEMERIAYAADMTRALLRMVVQASVVLAKAFVTGEDSLEAKGSLPKTGGCAVAGKGASEQGGASEGRSASEGTSASAGNGFKDRIFFVGTFVGAEENELARRMIAESMAQVGSRALFCRHAEFLGALGSISECLKRGDGRL